MNVARKVSTWISVSLAFALLMPATQALAQTFHQIGLLTANAGTVEITPGPPGSNTVWFTERSVNKIGRFDLSSGTVAEFTIPTTVAVDPATNPTGSSRPEFITAGPDGALWFTEGAGNKIGRITTAGAISEFVIPTANAHPLGIITGPDGNLWFTEESLPPPAAGSPKIGRITPGGAITEFPLPAASLPQVIVTGSDNNLWFTEFGTSSIGMIIPGAPNTITHHSIGITANSGPLSIVAGPDNNLWFTEQLANQIGRITPLGAVTEISIPTGNSQPFGIAVGPAPDHDIWFTEGNGLKVGHVNTASLVPTEVAKTSGTTAGQNFGLTTGPDSFLWFADDSRLSTTDPNFMATPTIIVTSTPNPSTAGTSVAFAAAVGPSNGTVGVVPTGTVSFLIDLTPSPAVTLSGNTAAISTAGLTVGGHNVSAIYSGDASFKPGTSAVFVQTVNAASGGGGGGGGGCTVNADAKPDAGLALLLLGSLAYLMRRRTRR
jgi:streptogramin lyase